MKFPRLELLKYLYGRPTTGDAFTECLKEVIKAKKAEKCAHPREEIARSVESVLKDDEKIEAEAIKKKEKEEAKKKKDEEKEED